MGIKEEIFKEFFEQLKSEMSIPHITFEEIEQLYINNNLDSKDNIFIAIDRGVNDANKN